MKVENMSWEILDAIYSAYGDNTEDGKKLLMACMSYLYNLNNHKDKKLDSQLDEIATEMGYCVRCGNKLVTEEWDEIHNELDDNPIEHFSEEFCPLCDLH